MPKSVHSERHRMIAAALASQRRAKGLSQAEVAKALGRHQPFIANIESGERRVDLVELLDIAGIIDLDVVALVRDLEDKSEPGEAK
ncbi:helix-turn-helix domain-containing protein [Mesorhizobium sp. CA18]|uniref:helix-turn-helix domain-containing protein n=1 Tax=unclassified Mesorhizobium TaxID=325217 RepID=UPI001CC9A7DE|nr:MULTISPECIES: helix-turn-helix transcriptional regulator [unclassified Mesorhizobium]MBZ9732234.1 helix-turn-helix domain-containing protein [Mesorhizobium sp. CA9]MBZ9823672.1 helix-turn-helix domain-containing protein [Mesorhizobium sp. CA18]MBZ9829900.1 helix-turn-helix domain-containing protein [Mesorhizobium sp. CA2]MBZ9836002.1 helix-turn-helix domain-containing protein [Mesorhizobium sp. CA3]MBZ9875314.1 helix-turn-helix domain-containing protein [Mesorhizobium sp. Ca11]